MPLPRASTSGVELPAASRPSRRVQRPEAELRLQDRYPRARRSHFGIESRGEIAADSPGSASDLPQVGPQKGRPADQLQCRALDTRHHPPGTVNLLPQRHRVTENEEGLAQTTFSAKHNNPLFFSVSL